MCCDIDQKVLVFDLGGETLDITLIKATRVNKEITIKTLAIDGDSHLGGSNWDDVLQQLLLNKIEDEYGIIADDELRREIRYESEKVKIRLTDKEYARRKIIYEGEYCTINVTREELECAAAHLNRHAISRIDSILETVEISDEDIDAVLAIGSATQMPMIRNLLIERFGNKVVFENPRSTVLEAALIADTIQQNIVHLDYNQSMECIMISYEDDREEKEILDTFNEIMMRKKKYLNTRQQVEGIMSIFEKLISDRKQIKISSAKLKNMEESRKQIEELIHIN